MKVITQFVLNFSQGWKGFENWLGNNGKTKSMVFPLQLN